MRKALFIFTALLTVQQLKAQVAGTGVYRFLDLHPSARVAALGGNIISIVDNDLNLGLQNPAVLNSSMHKQVTFNTVNFMSDINLGYAAYAHHLGDKIGTLSVGIQYANYGKFQGATASGTPTGTFTAGDYNLYAGIGRQWKKLHYGVALKTIYSSYDIYKSVGVVTDWGAVYNDTTSLLSAALVAKNLGYQVKPYTAGNREQLPFQIQAGFSKRLRHMPLRFSLLAHNLQRFDLTYLNPNKPGQQIDLETGLPVQEKITLADKAMRHMIIGTELLLSKGFNIRFGYNHLRRKEMTIDGKRGLVGFAWGFGIRINRFHISYASSSFYVGQNTNHFSFVTNLNSFKRKAKTKVVERGKL